MTLIIFACCFRFGLLALVDLVKYKLQSSFSLASLHRDSVSIAAPSPSGHRSSFLPGHRRSFLPRHRCSFPSGHLRSFPSLMSPLTPSSPFSINAVFIVVLGEGCFWCQRIQKTDRISGVLLHSLLDSLTKLSTKIRDKHILEAL